MQRSTLLVLIVLAAAVAFGVVARGSDQPEEPRFADGTSTAGIGVAGPDGKPVVCANGKELRVPLSRLLGPPTVTPATAARDALLTPRPGEDRVWRCGTGARPDLNARLVPTSDDPLTPGRARP
jgi:hypothetical protein